MGNKALSWRQLKNLSIDYHSFVQSYSFLEKLLSEDSGFLLFVDQRYSHEEDGVSKFLKNNSVKITSTDHIDSIQSIEGDCRDSDDNTWYLKGNYGVTWLLVPEYLFGNNDSSDLLKKSIDSSIDSINNILNKVEVSMSTKQRRTVTVQLFDNDSGLDAEHSLVASYENIITEDDDNTTIMEVIMNKGIAQKLKSHNELRSSQVDTAILESTGNEVFLRPVKLKDLTWVVK